VYDSNASSTEKRSLHSVRAQLRRHTGGRLCAAGAAVNEASPYRTSSFLGYAPNRSTLWMHASALVPRGRASGDRRIAMKGERTLVTFPPRGGSRPRAWRLSSGSAITQQVEQTPDGCWRTSDQSHAALNVYGTFRRQQV
jgi:hypothetical protein